MDNESVFPLGFLYVILGFSALLFISLVIATIEPTIVAKENYKERQKQLNELNLEKTTTEDINNFFTKTFYKETEDEISFFDVSLMLEKEEIAKKHKNNITKLNEYLKTGNNIEANKLSNEIKYNDEKIIYLKGNIDKIEKICKIYKMSFEDCNLIKWNDTYSDKVLNSNIKILEIN